MVLPDFAVSTKEAYAWLAHDRGTYEARSSVLQPTELDTWEGIAAVAMNDFEPVVGLRHPEIATYVEALRGAGALPAMMSGSGSAVFGIFADAERARAAVDAAARAARARARGLVVSTAARVERVAT